MIPFTSTGGLFKQPAIKKIATIMASKIEWTTRTWNPVTGCTKVSEACANCYAETMARRLKGMGQERYANGFQVTIHPDVLEDPVHWRNGMVFVCSMSDLFHEDVDFQYISRVFDIINHCFWLTFQVLTKRPERMAYFFNEYKYDRVPRNCWLGVTCENSRHYNRIDLLRTIEAPVRFISAEPLLGSMYDIPLNGIDWVITGGESGSRARPTDEHWFRQLRNRCVETGTAFFFKQWGTWGEDGIKRSKKENGRLLDGVEWSQYPKPRMY